MALALLRDVVGDVEIREPFGTFRENAVHKALVAARLSRSWALGEDSGLVVDALSGRPGVLSARLGGPGVLDADRVELLVRLLADVPPTQRTACFRSCVALASPDAHLGCWEGRCEGTIVGRPRGDRCSGYDPIFVASDQARTNAELAPDEKNAISHRGAAIRQFVVEALPGLLHA